MIVLDDDLVSSCYKFAIEVTETTYDSYKRRNPTLTKEKAINDHFKGKLCEWYSFLYLTYHGRKCTKPDMGIYEAKNKSYDADLEIIGHGLQIHVKACKPHLHSVLFEKDEVEHILQGNNHFVMIVEYTSPKEMKVISIRAAKDHQFKPPINPKLKSKLAVYL